MPPTHFAPRTRRANARRRAFARRMRWRATRRVRPPRSSSDPAVPCGETRPRRRRSSAGSTAVAAFDDLFADDPDFMLERDAEVALDPIASEVEQGQDVA